MAIEFEMFPGAAGVLFIGSSKSEAIAFYVQNGRLFFRYQHILDLLPVVMYSEMLPLGHITVRHRFEPGSTTDFAQRGNSRLWVNQTEVKRKRRGNTGFPPFTFTGKILGIAWSENGNQGTGE